MRTLIGAGTLALLAARTPAPVPTYPLPPAPAVRRTPPARLRANGVELEFDQFGDEADPPLLLIMGLAGQLVAWDEAFCARLAARGFRVIRFDNRDVGRSTWLDAPVPRTGEVIAALRRGERPRVPYLLSDMAADTLGLMDALGIDAAHLVGISMGGMIAQTAAIRAPQRVLSLTSLMSTTGEPELPRPERAAVAALMVPAPRTLGPYLRHAVRVWRVLNGRHIAVDRARTVAQAELAWQRGIHPAGATRQLAAVLATPHRAEALRALRVSTLVIHGAADPLIPLPCGLRTAELVPGATLEVIPRMGHALPPPLWERLVDAIADHAS